MPNTRRPARAALNDNGQSPVDVAGRRGGDDNSTVELLSHHTRRPARAALNDNGQSPVDVAGRRGGDDNSTVELLSHLATLRSR